MATIRLCSIPEIDSTYENILDLPTQTAINNFITSRTRFTLANINIKYDGSIKMIDVPKDYDTMHTVDYVEIYNNGWHTYYFIDSYEILSPEITRCYLTLDVWMSYQTEIEFRTSYVDRCHVDRWTSDGNPTKELVPETITSGEYVVEYDASGESTVTTNNGTYIYITSSPIGLIDKDPEGGTKPEPEPTETCPGNPSEGYVCSNGFRFIKGFEGYASNAYQDSGGVWTIGYGTTEIYDPENYETLYALQPAEEELCARVFWQSLHDGYGIPLRNQLQADGILGNISTWRFNALASFVYNAGLGSLIKSEMYSYIKSGDFETAAELWKNTNVHDSAGNLLPGLIARRNAESNIFLNAVYEFRPITNVSSGTVVEGDGWIPTESGIVGHDCKEHTPGPMPTDYTTDIEDELGNKYELPVGGRLSNVYPNYADGTYHGAIDIAGNDAQPIYAPKNNMTVVKVVGGYPNERNDSIGYGNYVVLEDNDTGIRSWYGHMRTTPSVNEGDSVGVNTILGYVGTSGFSTGPHLHYELRTSPYASGNRINPMKYIYTSDGNKHEPSVGENITRGQGVKN